MDTSLFMKHKILTIIARAVDQYELEGFLQYPYGGRPIQIRRPEVESLYIWSSGSNTIKIKLLAWDRRTQLFAEFHADEVLAYYHGK